MVVTLILEVSASSGWAKNIPRTPDPIPSKSSVAKWYCSLGLFTIDLISGEVAPRTKWLIFSLSISYPSCLTATKAISICVGGFGTIHLDGKKIATNFDMPELSIIIESSSQLNIQ